MTLGLLFKVEALGSTMLTVQIPGAFNSCQAYMELNLLQEATHSKLMHINPLIHTSNPTIPSRVIFHKGWSSFSHQMASRRWLVSMPLFTKQSVQI